MVKSDDPEGDLDDFPYYMLYPSIMMKSFSLEDIIECSYNLTTKRRIITYTNTTVIYIDPDGPQPGDILVGRSGTRISPGCGPSTPFLLATRHNYRMTTQDDDEVPFQWPSKYIKQPPTFNNCPAKLNKKSDNYQHRLSKRY